MSYMKQMLVLLAMACAVMSHDPVYKPSSGDGYKCVDIDECSSNNNHCPYSSTCVNVDGGYDCECDYGYVMVNGNCERDTSCQANNNGGCGKQRCRETSQGTECTCSGFTHSPTNVARGKRVEMSSQYRCTFHPYYCYHGSNAVDGQLLYDAYVNLASTDDETSPYMQIDLEEGYCITAVKVYYGLLRGGSPDLLVNVGDEQEVANQQGTNAECRFYYTNGQDEVMIDCQRTMFGRYVRITGLGIDQSMSVREIEVMAYS